MRLPINMNSVFALANEWLNGQVEHSTQPTPSPPCFDRRFRLKVCIQSLTFLLFIFLFQSLSNLASAQTLVIDINVVELNENQTLAIEQLNLACGTLNVGDTSVEATELREVCAEVNALDINDVTEAARLQEITGAIVPEEAFALNDSLSVFSDYQTTNVHSRLNALRNPILRSPPDPQRPPQQPDESSSDLSSDSVTINRLIKQPDTEPESGGGSSADLVSPLGAFVNGHASGGDFDGGRLQQDAEISSNRLTFGGDYRFNNNFVAGLGFGFAQDESDFSRVRGGADSVGFNVTAFATWYETDQGYVDVVLDVGRSDYTLERSVSISPDEDLIATAAPSATAASMTVSGGRNFRPFGFDLGGYIRLSYTGAMVDGYAESLQNQQPGFAALYSFNEQTVSSTKMVAGLNLSRAISFRQAVVLPLLRLEYIRENDQKKDALEATLISTGTSARYEGEERESGYANLGVGATAVIRGGRSAFAFYESQLQNEVVSQNWLKTGIRLEF